MITVARLCTNDNNRAVIYTTWIYAVFDKQPPGRRNVEKKGKDPATLLWLAMLNMCFFFPSSFNVNELEFNYANNDSSEVSNIFTSRFGDMYPFQYTSVCVHIHVMISERQFLFAFQLRFVIYVFHCLFDFHNKASFARLETSPTSGAKCGNRYIYCSFFSKYLDNKNRYWSFEYTADDQQSTHMRIN